MILCFFSNLFIYSIKNKSGFLYTISAAHGQKNIPVYVYKTEDVFGQAFKFVYL